MNYTTAPGILFKKRTTNVDDVITSVCEVMDISKEQLISKNRATDLVTARHLVAYYLRFHTLRLPVTQIAKILNRDHSTIVVSGQRLNALLHTKDEFICDRFERVKERLFVNSL